VTLLYAKVGTGYKSGGNQIRAISTNGDRLAFLPETITEYEVGIKGKIHNVRYGVAGFYNEVDNMQILSVLTQPTVYTLVKNAAKARNIGIEVQAEGYVTPNLAIHGSVAWIDPKFLSYNDPVSGVDLRTNRFNNVTEFQFTAGTDYYIKNVLLSANYVWMGKTDKLSTSQATLVGRYGSTLGNKIYNTTVIPSYGTLNLKASVSTEVGVFSVWGRNVLNQRIEKDMTPLEGLFNTTTLNDPVTYGISYSFSF
jgi:outer membrane cobalamin receptor